MKKSILTLVAALIVSSVAHADAHPCDDNAAMADAKTSAAAFDSYYKSSIANGTAPKPSSGAVGPVIGECGTANLRLSSGVFLVGLIVNRTTCGVNYYFETEAEKVAFAKWASAAVRKELALPSSVCVNLKAGI